MKSLIVFAFLLWPMDLAAKAQTNKKTAVHTLMNKKVPTKSKTSIVARGERHRFSKVFE